MIGFIIVLCIFIALCAGIGYLLAQYVHSRVIQDAKSPDQQKALNIRPQKPLEELHPIIAEPEKKKIKRQDVDIQEQERYLDHIKRRLSYDEYNMQVKDPELEDELVEEKIKLKQFAKDLKDTQQEIKG